MIQVAEAAPLVISHTSFAALRAQLWSAQRKEKPTMARRPRSAVRKCRSDYFSDGKRKVRCRPMAKESKLPHFGGNGSHRYEWPGRGLAPRCVYCGNDPNKLGREPTNEEAKAEVKRILAEGTKAAKEARAER